MTLWSVDVSQLRIPVGPWCSSWPSSWCSTWTGGSRTSVIGYLPNFVYEFLEATPEASSAAVVLRAAAAAAMSEGLLKVASHCAYSLDVTTLTRKNISE